MHSKFSCDSSSGVDEILKISIFERIQKRGNLSFSLQFYILFFDSGYHYYL